METVGRTVFNIPTFCRSPHVLDRNYYCEHVSFSVSRGSITRAINDIWMVIDHLSQLFHWHFDRLTTRRDTSAKKNNARPKDETSDRIVVILNFNQTDRKAMHSHSRRSKMLSTLRLCILNSHNSHNSHSSSCICIPVSYVLHRLSNMSLST